ncbi:MAG: sterol desaturase family protein [Thermodesulfobacteriota bacterium]
MEKISYDMIRLLILCGGLMVFLLLETILPYRESSVSKLKRWLNNIGLGVVNTVILQLLFTTMMVGVAAHSSTQQSGLLHFFNVPRWLKVLDTIVTMDLLLFLGHVLLHRLPLLWRIHRVHHTDLNVDVSTSLRRHLFEVVLSAMARTAGYYFLGADPVGVLIFELFYLLSDQIRHTSLRLPWGLERLLWLLFVPPGMHRVHHSVDTEERHTNFGRCFSVWDRLFGTMRTGVYQERIWYGVDGHIQEKKLDIQHLLAMPFLPPVK